MVPDAPWGLFELHDYADRVLCTRSSKQQQRQGGGLTCDATQTQPAVVRATSSSLTSDL